MFACVSFSLSIYFRLFCKKMSSLMFSLLLTDWESERVREKSLHITSDTYTVNISLVDVCLSVRLFSCLVCVCVCVVFIYPLFLSINCHMRYMLGTLFQTAATSLETKCCLPRSLMSHISCVVLFSVSLSSPLPVCACITLHIHRYDI